MVSAENLKEKSLHARVKGQRSGTLKAVISCGLVVHYNVTSSGQILGLIVSKSFQISHSRDGPTVTDAIGRAARVRARVPVGQQRHGWEIWESFSSGMRRLTMTTIRKVTS